VRLDGVERWVNQNHVIFRKLRNDHDGDIDMTEWRRSDEEESYTFLVRLWTMTCAVAIPKLFESTIATLVPVSFFYVLSPGLQ
jgi:hypothetical protein